MLAELRTASITQMGMTMQGYARAMHTEATMAACTAGVNKETFLAVAAQEYDDCAKEVAEQREIAEHNAAKPEESILVLPPKGILIT